MVSQVVGKVLLSVAMISQVVAKVFLSVAMVSQVVAMCCYGIPDGC